MKYISYFLIAVHIFETIKLFQKVLEQAHTIFLLFFFQKKESEAETNSSLPEN
jgi:hypothetical protein